jgi:MFS transporter, ACS family, glucarate transporter
MLASTSNPTPGCQLGRARQKVIAFAVVLGFITYVDRVCISQAAPFISHDLGLSPVEMGAAFSAFAWAYALFEVPGGWLADRYGPRQVLSSVVVWWSFFTAATGWAWNHASLAAARFLFGAGQAGCFPNLTKAFTNWLPGDERVRAQGIMWLSARWGGAFTPLLVVAALHMMNWRAAFFVFSLLGVVWTVCFWRWFRDHPAQSVAVNEAGPTHEHVPWKRFTSSRTVWLLWAQYFCTSWGWYFYITWLPTYLKEARNVDLTQAAVLAGLPLFFGGIGSFFCGMILGWLVRFAGCPARARRFMASVGCAGAGALLVVSMQIQEPLWAMVVMGLASFSNDLAMPPSWAACMDVGGEYAGTLSGSMNMMGNLAGGVAPIIVGLVLQYSHHNWAATFYLSAAVYGLGALCWLFIDPVTPLDKEAKS